MLRTEAEQSKWIWLILMVGFALRSYGLGQESLWLDEVVTAKRVYDPISQLLYGWDSETQGPLFYLWVKAWGLIFGTSEVSLRFWSVIFGTLTIPLVYILGKQNFSGTGSVLAALFFAVHPFAIYYSQEARPYALFLFLSVASFILLLSLMRQHRLTNAASYVIITALAYYTHVYAAFLILSHILIYYSFRRDGKYRGSGRYPKPYYLTFVVLCILCIPETMQNAFALMDKFGQKSMAGWIESPGFLSFANTPARYFMAVRIGQAVMLIVVVLAALRFYSEPRLKLGFRFLLILGICFWLIPWVVSITVTPVFVLRYTIPGLLIVVFLMATASATLQALPRQLFVTALLALTMFPLWSYYTKVDKDPWRQTGEYLSARLSPTDIVIPYPPYTALPIKHYLLPHLRDQVTRADSLGQLEPLVANAQRIWVVESYSTNDPEDNAMLPLLHSAGHELRTINISETLDLNPTRFWVCPMKIILRENTLQPIPFGPELPDSLSS